MLQIKCFSDCGTEFEIPSRPTFWVRVEVSEKCFVTTHYLSGMPTLGTFSELLSQALFFSFFFTQLQVQQHILDCPQVCTIAWLVRPDKKWKCIIFIFLLLWCFGYKHSENLTVVAIAQDSAPASPLQWLAYTNNIVSRIKRHLDI